MLHYVGNQMHHTTRHIMPAVSNQRDLALHLLGDRGIMRLSELKDRGVSPPTVSRLVDDGLVVRTSRGLYELSGIEIDRAHSLAEMAKRVPRGVDRKSTRLNSSHSS